MEKVCTTPGAGGMRLEPLLDEVITTSSTGLESKNHRIFIVAFLLSARRDLREGQLRNVRVPCRENVLHLKQERLQLDARWDYLTIQVTASWNELLKAILQP